MAHMILSVRPLDNDNPGFSQIFVVGTGGTEEAKHQIKKSGGARWECDHTIKAMAIDRLGIDGAHEYHQSLRKSLSACQNGLRFNKCG
jgi:hypothetical protein